MAYTMQQLMDAAKQAGFSGPALAQAVAIAWAESGQGSQVVGDHGDSLGVTQINMPTWGSKLNIDPERLKNDPVYAFQLMDQISHGGSNFGDWTTWSGATPEGKAANAHQYLGQTYQMLGLDPSTAPKAPAGGSTPSGANPNTAAPAKTKLPSDTTLYQVEGQGLFAVYDVGGVKLRFQIDPATVDISGVQAQAISAADWQSLNTVNAPGGTAELDSVAKNYGTFSAYFDHTLQQVLPPNSSASMDAGVRGVIAQLAANPSLLNSPSAIQQMLSRTPWYQSNTDQSRKYNESSQAEQKAMVSDEAVRLAQLYTEKTGETVMPNDPRITAWALDVASGKRGEGAVLYEEILPRAQTNPDSPWSRDRRQETVDEHKHANDISTKAAEITDSFRRWGIPIADSSAQQWAQQITDGLKSDGDLQTYLQGQSKILYPWKDPSTPTVDAAQPWVDTYKRILEQDPTDGIQDPVIQKALNNGTPLWQFQQELKSDPRWMSTDNARNDMTSAFMTAGRIMGFE